MPLHPMLVHLPIALAVVMPLLGFGLLVAWRRGALQRRTWLVAVALQAMLLGSGLAALRSGQSEEDRVEQVIAESAIEAHEEAAEVFVIGAGVVLALALAAAVLRRETAARGIAALSVAGALGVLALGYRTGRAGGDLVYRDGAATVYATPSNAALDRSHE